jgi:hypothetical protein
MCTVNHSMLSPMSTTKLLLVSGSVVVCEFYCVDNKFYFFDFPFPLSLLSLFLLFSLLLLTAASFSLLFVV